MLLALTACLGSLVAAEPAAAQQAWPLPGLTCEFSYQVHVDPAGSSVSGSGKCLKPNGSLVNAQIAGRGSGGPTGCAPSLRFDVSSGSTLLVDELVWQRTPLLPPRADIPSANVMVGPLSSLAGSGSGTGVSVGTINCSSTPHSGIYDESGIAVLSFRT